ncbi:HEPN domain-containing protein [Nitratifractor salsuginis]|uniref:HEPN domain-containing protein n=1 Tax=Nitratifractor salsuginis TaxID=269261 RepID=UPI00031DF7ED|nr:HEPN domain-containing protein [Nitratifractor salsuginis]
MKDETRLWIEYAEENLASAKILLESHLYNPALQNTQQAIEKYLKAYIIEFGLGLPKTHNIAILKSLVEDHGTPNGQ